MSYLGFNARMPEFTSTISPGSLKREIEEKSNSFKFDLYKILGIEI